MDEQSRQGVRPVVPPGPVDVGRIFDDGPLGGYQQGVISLTALAVILDGVDSQLLGIVIPTMMADWGLERSAFAPVLAIGFVGMMVGGFVAGVAGDRWGRRVALIVSVFIFGLMTLGASFAGSLIVLGALRFFVGIGLQGASPNAAALVSEYSPMRYRAVAVTATIVCVPLGAMMAGLLALPILPVLGWRVLLAVGGALSVVVGVLLLKLLPESPRYLARHPARWGELAMILRRVKVHVPPEVRFVDLADPVASTSQKSTLLSGESRLDTLALWSAFFFCLLAVYSGFNWIPSLLTGAGFGATIANSGITAYNLGGVVGALGGAFAIKRFGSKPTMLLMAAGASSVAAGMGSMTFAPDAPVLPIIAMLAITGGLINAVQVTMYALAAHVYPTGIRATGVGLATSVGRVGAILSTYAGAWALDLGGNLAFFTVVAAAMAAVFLSLALIRRHIPGAVITRGAVSAVTPAS